MAAINSPNCSAVSGLVLLLAINIERGGIGFLGTPVTGERHGTAAYVSRDQIYSFLDIAPERQNNYNAQRIRELMANHGWKYDRRRINKKWVWAFWNPCRPE